MGFNMPEDEAQHRFAEGIPQTITLLEGLVRVLRRSVRTSQATLPPRPCRLTGLDLHPRIADVWRRPLPRRHYRNAVLDASSRWSTSVRRSLVDRPERGGLNADGVLHGVHPRFNDLRDDTDRASTGAMHLFEGAVSHCGKPAAHALSGPRRTRPEYIALFFFSVYSPSGWSRRSGADANPCASPPRSVRRS